MRTKATSVSAQPAASRLKSPPANHLLRIPMPAPIPVFDIGNVLVRWDPRHLYRKLIPEELAREDFLTRICSPGDLGIWRWTAVGPSPRAWRSLLRAIPSMRR